MKRKALLRKVSVVLLIFIGLSSCISNVEEEGRKTTDYREYDLTVASEKLPGVVTSSGSNLLGEVYAVKRDNSSEWEAMGGIDGFDYEEGFEYRVRISETSYLDERMGDPAWTEHKLKEVLSKERKTSEGLPMNFIPSWYFGNKEYIDPEYVYAIDADNIDEIEEDLGNDESLRFDGYRYYLCNGDRWFKLDSDMRIHDQGIVERREKNSSEFPESYKLVMPQEYQMVALGRWDFVTKASTDDPVIGYDVWISRQFPTKSEHMEKYRLWLFKDLTESYQIKYPEANVKAVAVRYALKQ